MSPPLVCRSTIGISSDMTSPQQIFRTFVVFGVFLREITDVLDNFNEKRSDVFSNLDRTLNRFLLIPDSVLESPENLIHGA